MKLITFKIGKEEFDVPKSEVLGTLTVIKKVLVDDFQFTGQKTTKARNKQNFIE